MNMKRLMVGKYEGAGRMLYEIPIILIKMFVFHPSLWYTNITGLIIIE